MPDEITPDEEFIWVDHEIPEILPARIARAALECEDGMAEKGWREMKSPPELDEEGKPIPRTTHKPTTTHNKKADHAAAVNPED